MVFIPLPRVIVRFEHAYYDIEIQHVSHLTTETTPIHFESIFKYENYILFFIYDYDIALNIIFMPVFFFYCLDTKLIKNL